MDKRNLHPVDDYFISKVNEGSKNISYNKASWDQLSARLDKHSIKPTPTGKFNFIGKNIYILSLFITAVILTCGIFFLSEKTEEISHTDKIDHQAAEEPISEESNASFKPKIIPIETEKILSKNEDVQQVELHEIQMTSITPPEPEDLVKSNPQLPEIPFESAILDGKNFHIENPSQQSDTLKIVKFSLPEISVDKEKQTESTKDSLFIFW